MSVESQGRLQHYCKLMHTSVRCCPHAPSKQLQAISASVYVHKRVDLMRAALPGL